MVLSLSERFSRGLLLCDGATGTQLYAHGLTAALPEPANVAQPDVVKGVHLSYLRAGAELIESNTFGANALKLGMHGMASRVEELNRAGVALAREAAQLHGQNVWVAGSMGPLPSDTTGAGLFSPASAWNVFAEQASALSDGGADLILLETFTSLAQLRQAIDAVHSVSELPVIAQMTFTGDGLTPGGDAPEDIATALNDAGTSCIRRELQHRAGPAPERG